MRNILLGILALVLAFFLFKLIGIVVGILFRALTILSVAGLIYWGFRYFFDKKE